MAGLNSIMDLFRSAPQQAATAPTATAQPPQPGQPTPGSGVVPTGVANSAATSADPAAFQNASGQQGEKAPMAQFAELWKIDPNTAPRNPVAALTPNFNVDPAKVAEAASKVDFISQLPKELLAKVQGGDQAAFVDVINRVGQAATANAGMNTAKIVEAALAHQAKQFAEILPQEVRKLQNAQAVQQNNPLYDNPATKPMVEALATQFSAKYPTATATQINDHVKEYLDGVVVLAGGTLPDPKAAAAAATAKANEVDWLQVLGGDAPQ